jgi:hypothetical protein
MSVRMLRDGPLPPTEATRVTIFQVETLPEDLIPEVARVDHVPSHLAGVARRLAVKPLSPEEPVTKPLLTLLRARKRQNLNSLKSNTSPVSLHTPRQSEHQLEQPTPGPIYRPMVLRRRKIPAYLLHLTLDRHHHKPPISEAELLVPALRGEGGQP